MDLEMPTWSAVVAVRPWWLAPDRFGPGADRIVRAMALDVLDVVAAADCVEHVVVVTGEPEAAAFARRHAMAVLEDRPLLSTLGDAVQRGVRWIGGRHAGTPVAVVPATLPALTTESLTEALVRLGAVGEACVPDAQGRGATLRATSSPADFVAATGPGAMRTLSRVGVRGVTAVETGVRADVQTREALLGLSPSVLGPRTAELVHELSAAPARA